MIDDSEEYKEYLTKIGFLNNVINTYISYLNQCIKILQNIPEYSNLHKTDKLMKFAIVDKLFKKDFDKYHDFESESLFNNLKSASKRYKYYIQYLGINKILKIYDNEKSEFGINQAVEYFKIFNQNNLYPVKAICQKITLILELNNDFTTNQGKSILRKVFNNKNTQNIEFINISNTQDITHIEKLIPLTAKQKDNIYSNEKLGNLTFPHKNILLKGVPGTGKSRAVENIIKKQLELENHKENVLRINIHSASSNADLMQGIGISSSDGKIEYKEKQGLILDIIQRATFKPKQPFVLILEEIQENSLNELIGDLIYLIEDDKRAKNIVADDDEYEYQILVEKIIEADPTTSYVEIPYLVNDSTEYRKMIMPNNLYIFCTSNYRDDKKVIEDNLLRRFEVLEVYPKERVAHEYCRAFFKGLNENILSVLKDEIHPDRFLIGHAIWKDVSDNEKFYRAFLKVVVEFKDIKEIEFDEFKKIVENIKLPNEVETLNLENYMRLIQNLQTKAGYDFLD